VRDKVLVLVGRAANIYPLSFLANYFREHKITPKMQFIMWFSGKYVTMVATCGDWLVLRPTWHKICHSRDVLHSLSFSL